MRVTARCMIVVSFTDATVACVRVCQGKQEHLHLLLTSVQKSGASGGRQGYLYNVQRVKYMFIIRG